jgi:uncharacterized protein YqgC (DUF456 family)
LTLQVSPKSSVWDLWAANFLTAEFILAGVAGALFAGWIQWGGGAAATTQTLVGGWPTFFSTLVTLFGALFGFVLTAASITVALVTEERMRVFVEGKKYPQVWDTFTQTILTLGVAAAVAFMGLVFSAAPGTHLLFLCLLVFLGILASLRLTRTVWLLDGLPRLHAAMVTRKRAE